MINTVEGPNWTPSGLDVYAGRFPLRVEGWVGNIVARLVPAVTAVTTHAPYYLLHPLIYDEAERRGLEGDARRSLLRRAEVVLAGITHAHAEHVRPIDIAHGADKIGLSMQTVGKLDVRALAEANGYSTQVNGFSGAYLNSERLLGLVGAGSQPSPGSRYRSDVARSALGSIFALADEDEVSLIDLQNAQDLCLCHAPERADGSLLAEVFCHPSNDESFRRDDDVRRASVTLLTRVVDIAGASGSLEHAFGRAVAFGEFLETDPVSRDLVVSAPWRGVVLRNYSVTAWRRLWAHIIDELLGSDPLEPAELAARVVAGLEAASGYHTLGDLLSDLPPSKEGSALAPAEELLLERDAPFLVRQIGLLGLGSTRCNDLEGGTRQIFIGRDDELGPLWVERHFDANRNQRLEEFAANLVLRLIERARRVALSKAAMTRTGMVIPSRFREREGRIFAISDEGSGPIGLRIESLGSVLFGVGVLDWVPGPAGLGTWTTTELTRRLIG